MIYWCDTCKTMENTMEDAKAHKCRGEVNDEHIVMCETPTIPTAKKYKETQFSTVKRRSGKESVPFLGLEVGEHKVRFYNDRKEATLRVKVWLSPYGWAWKILGT